MKLTLTKAIYAFQSSKIEQYFSPSKPKSETSTAEAQAEEATASSVKEKDTMVDSEKDIAAFFNDDDDDDAFKDLNF